MPGEPTTHCRIKVRTRERIWEAIASILDGVEKGWREDPGIRPEGINPRFVGWSFDDMLGMLLDELEAHRARARKQKRRKRKT
jgi:hypothetical protein